MKMRDSFGASRAARTLLLVFSLAYFTTYADSKLLLTYYIHRYGARNILPKSALLSESNATGGPALLPFGRQQNHDAGLEFRSRYLLAASCSQTDTCLSIAASSYGVFGRPGVEYNNYNTLVRSSGLDRTISAANAFVGGMFPDAADSTIPDPNQVLPVYSFNDTDDWLIRAYTKCPTYNKKLEEWYRGPEFATKVQQSAALRNKVAAMEPTLNTSLTNWWNVYDAFNTWQSYGYGNPLPRLDNATFAQMVELANWLEAAKMRSTFTGNLLGGPLLADLLQYMSAAAGASNDSVYYKLVGISGHYNVLMALPSALKLDQGRTAVAYPWKDHIAPFASLLVFELHADDSGSPPHVRAVYQEGPTTQYRTMPLPCAKTGDAAEALLGPGACTYQSFVDYAGPLAVGDPAEWCTACQNQQASVCRIYWDESSGKVGKLGKQGQHVCKWDETTTIVVCVVCSSVGTALLIALGFAVYRWKGSSSLGKRGKHLELLDLPSADTIPVSNLSNGVHV